MKFFSLILISCLFSACSGTRYYLNIDSMAPNFQNGSSAFVVIADDKDPEILKEEYRRHAETALKEAGFLIAESLKQADQMVLVSYAISSSQKVASEPTYTWVAPKSYNYSGSTYGSYGNSYTSGTIRESGIGHMEQSGTNVYTYTEYTRAVFFTGYSAKEALEYFEKKRIQKPQEVWHTKIISSGSSGDFRKVFPVLMAGAVPYLGKDTGGQVNVDLSENDDSIQRIKQGGQSKDARVPAAEK